MLAQPSSITLLPPRSPCVFNGKPWKLRVGNNHSWSRLSASKFADSKLSPSRGSRRNVKCDGKVVDPNV